MLVLCLVQLLSASVQLGQQSLGHFTTTFAARNAHISLTVISFCGCPCGPIFSSRGLPASPNSSRQGVLSLFQVEPLATRHIYYSSPVLSADGSAHTEGKI